MRVVQEINGERLRDLRESRGHTQDAVAYGVGVARLTISRWERGLHFPRPKYFPRLAEFFGVTTKELVKTKAPAETTGASKVLR